MILSGKEIKKRLNKDIIIKPFSDKQLNPNSYNLCLGNELMIYDRLYHYDKNDYYANDCLDIKRDNDYKSIPIPNSGLILQPGKLYLGNTREWTETYNLVPMIEGRSGIARLGIFIHVTAGFGDVGFKGRWTLEISCIEPVKIYPWIEICQIYYHTIDGDDYLYLITKKTGYKTVVMVNIKIV